MVKTPCRNAGDMGSIPGWGRSHMPCGVTKKKKKKDAGAGQLQRAGQG